MMKIKKKYKHKCKIWKACDGYWSAACFHKKCAGLYPWFHTWQQSMNYVINHQKTRDFK